MIPGSVTAPAPGLHCPGPALADRTHPCQRLPWCDCRPSASIAFEHPPLLHIAANSSSLTPAPPSDMLAAQSSFWPARHQRLTARVPQKPGTLPCQIQHRETLIQTQRHYFEAYERLSSFATCTPPATDTLPRGVRCVEKQDCASVASLPAACFSGAQCAVACSRTEAGVLGRETPTRSTTRLKRTRREQ
eukprot:1911918-Rhodomonas_salina.1